MVLNDIYDIIAKSGFQNELHLTRLKILYLALKLFKSHSPSHLPFEEIIS